MANLEVVAFIPAPAQAVWDVLADIDGQAAWMVDVRTLRVVSELRRGVGTVIRVKSELFGRPVVDDVMVITRWEPPHRMSVEHRGAFHGCGDFILDAAENGTIFTWTENFEAPLGAIGDAAFALVVRPHLERAFARSLARLRRLVLNRTANDAR